MPHHRSSPLRSPQPRSSFHHRALSAVANENDAGHHLSRTQRFRGCKAVTLVEAMISLLIMAMFMLGFLGSFLQSRRVTESSVLHAAATAVIYGMIEEIKQLDYTSNLPSNVPDPTEPTGKPTPYVRVRLNQSTIVWLSVVNTPASTAANPTTPQGPTTTPPIGTTPPGAVDNLLPSLPLSTIASTGSQPMNLNLWVWIDTIPDPNNDVTQIKKVTIIYTYDYQDGKATRTIRDREVFLRSKYDQ